MMDLLMARGERLAQDRLRLKTGQVAEQLRSIFGSAAVEVEEARVLVRGRGIIKRWLIDPSLRFLVGGFR
jgi:hypothetical protein